MQRLTPDRLEQLGHATRLGAAPPSPSPKGPAPTDAAAVAVADPRRIEEEQRARAFEQARERGHDAGLADAEQEIVRRVDEAQAQRQREHAAAMTELTEARERFDALARAIPDALAGNTTDIEDAATEVAFAALLRLLEAKDAEQVLLREFCRQLAGEYAGASATLRVSEDDALLLADFDPGMAIEADRRLRAGQCVVDTARGQFDTGLDVRLAALMQAFLAGLASRRRTA